MKNKLLITDKNPLVTLIIPIYNASRWLAETLTCVVNQEYKNLEIILIDDGSTDESFTICERFAKANNNWNVLRQSNSGESSARNTGIRNANGEWIIFADADDLIKPKYISLLVNQITIPPPTFIAYDRITNMRTTTTGIKFEENIYDFKENHYDYQAVLKMMLSRDCLNSACCKLYNRETIRDVQFNEAIKLGPDFLFNIELVCKIQKEVKIVKLKESQYIYRRIENSAVERYRNYRSELQQKILETIEAAHLSNPNRFEISIYKFRTKIRQAIETGNSISRSDISEIFSFKVSEIIKVKMDKREKLLLILARCIPQAAFSVCKYFYNKNKIKL